MEDTNVHSGAVATGTASILINIYTAPREAFAALAVRPTVLLPILALVIANVALVIWYYNQVDVPWLIQTSLEAAGQEVPPELANGQAAGMTAPIMTVFAAVSTVLRVLIVLLVVAGYLTLVSLFTNEGIGFKRWLSLAAWSSMPTLLGTLSALINIAVNDATFMPPTELNMLSFGNLLGIDPAGGGILRTLLLSMDVTVVWALALMTFGYALWTRRSAFASIAVVAGPPIVLCGLAFAFAAM
jgi:hypothetical protein